tara:strand:+ start:318 stop:488 length:171 start_codon:yes stop_codon:yes gene_type:complete
MGWVPKENGLSECESSELLVWDYVYVSLSDFSLFLWFFKNSIPHLKVVENSSLEYI